MEKISGTTQQNEQPDGQRSSENYFGNNNATPAGGTPAEPVTPGTPGGFMPSGNPQPGAPQQPNQSGYAPQQPNQQQSAQPGVDAGAQMKEGLSQFAGGATHFFKDSVAPAAADALNTTSAAVKKFDSEKKLPIGPLAMAIGGLLALLSLFMPIVSVVKVSFGWFSELPGGASTDGPILLVSAILVIGFSTLAFITTLNAKSKKWMWLVASIIGIIGGIMFVFDGFGVASKLSELTSPGFGVILLGLSGLVVIAGAIYSLITMKKYLPKNS